MMVVVIDLDILEQVPLGVCQMGKDLTIQKLFPALSQQFPSRLMLCRIPCNCIMLRKPSQQYCTPRSE